MKNKAKWARDMVREDYAFELKSKLLKQVSKEYFEFDILDFGKI